MAKSIKAPVGRRWRTQNVANRAADQQTIIELLHVVPVADGGRRETWKVAPWPGPDGQCPPELAEAIWAFQQTWKSRGAVRHVDGVIEPDQHAFHHLAKLAEGLTPPPPPPQLPGGEMIERIVIAFTHAVRQWALYAQLRDVNVVGASAFGGKVFAPELLGLMRTRLSAEHPGDQRILDAAAHWLAGAFKQWQESITVPGLMWYPAFAAFPGGIAPSMPNTACQLVELVGTPFGTALTGHRSEQAALEEDVRRGRARSDVADIFRTVETRVATDMHLFVFTSMVTEIYGSGFMPGFTALAGVAPVHGTANGRLIST